MQADPTDQDSSGTYQHPCYVSKYGTQCQDQRESSVKALTNTHLCLL